MKHGDDELVRRMAAGDAGAVEELYARHADRLLRFAMLRLGHREEAQDAVQETMLAAWQGASSFRGSSSVGTWLFGICRNKAGEALRRRRPSGDLDEAQQFLARPSGEDPDLWRHLWTLSLEHREALVLSLYYGFSLAEVAQTQGVPEGTAKSRVHYARKELQRLMQGGTEA